jgi:hypothetical protein
MPLIAVRHIRKMRGGAQSHLLQADDGNWYVVKFRNNPQHRRVLVNELIASVMLGYLRIPAPETALVEVTAEFLASYPEICFHLGGQRVAVEPGWHFGSRYPGDPARIAVYDYLPDQLIAKVVNVEDFRAILVFDKWVSNSDGRQSIFYRAMVQRGVPASIGRPGFVAWMIDHGFAFNGPNWDFPESANQGLYARPIVYDPVRSLDDFQPWLDLVKHFPEEVVDRAWKGIPPEWISGEETELERLLERLLDRRARVASLVEACRKSSRSPFPRWR